jgi:indole-3-glycerol phosphate synthase
MGFLEDTVVRRRERIRLEFGGMSAADRERVACCARPVRDFGRALTDGPDVAVIGEVKKASPTEGQIAPECEASKQALHYQAGGAAAISVLTEPESFGGSFTDLSDVSDAVDLPVLAKDFVVDPIQLFLARGRGADSVLLMVTVLGQELGDYVDLARTLGLQPVVEVVDGEELEVALDAGACIIGVNSRDLSTLNVDRDAALAVVSKAARSGVTVISASGVRQRSDVAKAATAGADAVLVGTVLMKARFPEDVLEDLTGVARSAPVSS